MRDGARWGTRRGDAEGGRGREPAPGRRRPRVVAGPRHPEPVPRARAAPENRRMCNTPGYTAARNGVSPKSPSARGRGRHAPRLARAAAGTARPARAAAGTQRLARSGGWNGARGCPAARAGRPGPRHPEPARGSERLPKTGECATRRATRPPGTACRRKVLQHAAEAGTRRGQHARRLERRGRHAQRLARSGWHAQRLARAAAGTRSGWNGEAGTRSGWHAAAAGTARGAVLQHARGGRARGIRSPLAGPSGSRKPENVQHAGLCGHPEWRVPKKSCRTRRAPRILEVRAARVGMGARIRARRPRDRNQAR
jgi:hypothetical protein